jgi:hypothetical protein
LLAVDLLHRASKACLQGEVRSFLRHQPGLEFLKRFSVAAHEKPAVLKTDGDTPIVADFRYFPDFISQSEFAFPGERFGKEFDLITYLETIPFHLAFALSPSSTS